MLLSSCAVAWLFDIAAAIRDVHLPCLVGCRKDGNVVRYRMTFPLRNELDSTNRRTPRMALLAMVPGWDLLLAVTFFLLFITLRFSFLAFRCALRLDFVVLSMPCVDLVTPCTGVRTTPVALTSSELG
uniref:Putative secreted peptide n=1 Tax=Anopheles braziliensis TaxID=58242 RepID=A0A2M3ZRN9_9DIPT